MTLQRGVPPRDEIRERIWAEAYIACVSAGGMQGAFAEAAADLALKKFDDRFRKEAEKGNDDAKD